MILHCADCNILNETNYDSFEKVNMIMTIIFPRMPTYSNSIRALSLFACETLQTMLCASERCWSYNLRRNACGGVFSF